MQKWLIAAVVLAAASVGSARAQEHAQAGPTAPVLNAPGCAERTAWAHIPPSVLVGQQPTPWSWASSLQYWSGGGGGGRSADAGEVNQARRQLRFAAMQARAAGGGGGALGPGNMLAGATRLR